MVEPIYHLSFGCKVITFIDYRCVVVDKYTRHDVSSNINGSTEVNLLKLQLYKFWKLSCEAWFWYRCSFVSF